MVIKIQQITADLLECFLNIGSSFCWYIKVFASRLLNLLSQFWKFDHVILWRQVWFVADNVNWGVIASWLLDKIYPPVNRFIGLNLCQVKHYKGCLTITQIPWYQASESLLTCCVPQLESYNHTGNVDVFRYEIDSNSWVVSGVELVLDESVDDWAFSYSLVANEHQLAFEDVLFAGRITDLFVLFLVSFHFLFSTI